MSTEINSTNEDRTADQREETAGVEHRSEGEEHTIRIVLEIERGGPCVMDGIDGDILDAEIRYEDGRCRSDIDIREQTPDGTREHTKQFTSTICAHCPRDIFSRYGCIPRYLEVGSGWFVVETYLPNTETVSSLVSEIRECCERVRLRSLNSTDRERYAENCSVDVSLLTPKQREAVHTAKQLGYYDADSAVDLEQIAQRLDISTSALSQRLSRAEANVLRQIPCECSCWDE